MGGKLAVLEDGPKLKDGPESEVLGGELEVTADEIGMLEDILGALEDGNETLG